jgi:D-glucuronyl C5-epimerase C-terminus
VYDERQVMKPFLWSYIDYDNSAAGFEVQLEYGDPLRATTLLLQDWHARHDSATTLARVERMVARWHLDEPDGKLTYDFAYNDLPANWRSGMDSWSFPLLLLQAWQSNQSPRLKSLADKLIATASKDVTDGGVVWRGADGCWLSEYAFDGMFESREYYVLNGHLYALQAIRMIADISGDETLRELYACGVRGTKARAESYLLGTAWVRYMLQPKVINQTHYVIFESMQFDALAMLDQDPFFVRQAQLRRDLLQRYFPVVARTSPSGNRLVFSTIAAPHPYSVDTYPIYLACSDGIVQEQHAVEAPYATGVPVAERAFLDAPTNLDPALALCKVESRYAGYGHTLYEGPVIVFAEPVSTGVNIEASFEAQFDAIQMDATNVTVDPARRFSVVGSPPSYLDVEGRLVFTPRVAVDWPADALIGVEFDADGALAVGVTVKSGGGEYFRYYPRTLAGNKVLVLLSPLGFDGGEAIQNLERLTLFVYTDKQSTSVLVRNPRLRKFNNAAELQRYFSDETPTFYTE